LNSRLLESYLNKVVVGRIRGYEACAELGRVLHQKWCPL
jgi:hypothetical protein